jgi:hypothetical protein
MLCLSLADRSSNTYGALCKLTAKAQQTPAAGNMQHNVTVWPLCPRQLLVELTCLMDAGVVLVHPRQDVPTGSGVFLPHHVPPLDQ